MFYIPLCLNAPHRYFILLKIKVEYMATMLYEEHWKHIVSKLLFFRFLKFGKVRIFKPKPFKLIMNEIKVLIGPCVNVERNHHPLTTFLNWWTFLPMRTIRTKYFFPQYVRTFSCTKLTYKFLPHIVRHNSRTSTMVKHKHGRNINSTSPQKQSFRTKSSFPKCTSFVLLETQTDYWGYYCKSNPCWHATPKEQQSI